MSGNPSNKPKAATGPPRPPFGDITNTVSGGASSSTAGPASSAGGAANSSTSNAAAAGTTAAPKGPPIADILSAWDHKTPAQKQEWSEETFGSKEPPWAGEEAYDDGADVEYEESMKSSRPE